MGISNETQSGFQGLVDAVWSHCVIGLVFLIATIIFMLWRFSSEFILAQKLWLVFVELDIAQLIILAAMLLVITYVLGYNISTFSRYVLSEFYWLIRGFPESPIKISSTKRFLMHWLLGYDKDRSRPPRARVLSLEKTFIEYPRLVKVYERFSGGFELHASLAVIAMVAAFLVVMRMPIASLCLVGLAVLLAALAWRRFTEWINLRYDAVIQGDTEREKTGAGKQT